MSKSIITRKEHLDALAKKIAERWRTDELIFGQAIIEVTYTKEGLFKSLGFVDPSTIEVTYTKKGLVKSFEYIDPTKKVNKK